MKIPGTEFVVFHVSDLARTARFYRETLGLRQELYSEGWEWAELNCGNVTLVLRNGANPQKSAGCGRIVLPVENVHAARALLQRKGVRVFECDGSAANCALEVFDPDGNKAVLQRAKEEGSRLGSSTFNFEI